jgi:DNA-binding NarL/FixJ family response regulator
VRVLVVDDQARARQGLKALLATCAEIELAGLAASGAEALQAVPRARPDLVLMDARMPEIDGLEATRLIKIRWPAVKVVVLSMYSEYAAAATAAGADAFVSKGASLERLLATLLEVAGGQAPA